MLKNLFLTLALAVGLLSPAHSAGLYPLSNYQQFDSNGKLLAGAKLYLFNGGTTTPRIGYKDSSLTSPHPNPIVADASGRIPLIYLADGFYRQRLTTATGTQIFDQDGLPVLSSTAGGSGTSVDPDSVYKTGDIKVSYDNQPIAGYVRVNGRTIGSAASGATERANLDTQPLYEKLWSFSNVTVVGGKGASAVADYTANKPLTLPNAAGRGIFGVDDMGAGAQNVLTGETMAAATTVGSPGGSQTVNITPLMLPNYQLTGGSGLVSVSGSTGIESAGHTHTGSGTTGAVSSDHTHTGGGSTSGMSANVNHTHQYDRATASATGANFPVGNPGNITNTATTSSNVNLEHTHSYSFTTSGASSNHTHDYSFTTGPETVNHTHALSASGTATGISILSGGGGAASANLPPVILFTIYMRL